MQAARSARSRQLRAPPLPVPERHDRSAKRRRPASGTGRVVTKASGQTMWTITAFPANSDFSRLRPCFLFVAFHTSPIYPLLIHRHRHRKLTNIPSALLARLVAIHHGFGFGFGWKGVILLNSSTKDPANDLPSPLPLLLCLCRDASSLGLQGLAGIERPHSCQYHFTLLETHDAHLSMSRISRCFACLT